MPQLKTDLLAEETFFDTKRTIKLRQVIFATCLRRYFIVIPPFLFAHIFHSTEIAIRIIGTHQIFAAYFNIINKTFEILYNGLPANFEYAEKIDQRRLRKWMNMSVEDRLKVKNNLESDSYEEELTEKDIEDDKNEQKLEQERLDEMKGLLGDMLINFKDEFVLIQKVNQEPLVLMQFLEDRVIKILAAFKYINKEPGTYEEHLNKLEKCKTTFLVRMKKGRCEEDHYEQVLHETERANQIRRDAINKMLQVEGLDEKQKNLYYSYMSN